MNILHKLKNDPAIIDLAIDLQSEYGPGECMPIAQHGALGLRELGYCDARTVKGYAAWRVGRGDGDVLGHHPETINRSSEDEGELFHMWCEVGSVIVDLSTGNLRLLAMDQDARDGQHTTFEWDNPVALIASWLKVKPYATVRDSYQVGVVHYSRLKGE